MLSRKHSLYLLALCLPPALSMGIAYGQLHSEASQSDYAFINANWEFVDGETLLDIENSFNESGTITSRQAIRFRQAMLQDVGALRIPTDNHSTRSEERDKLGKNVDSIGNSSSS